MHRLTILHRFAVVAMVIGTSRLNAQPTVREERVLKAITTAVDSILDASSARIEKLDKVEARAFANREHLLTISTDTCTRYPTIRGCRHPITDIDGLSRWRTAAESVATESRAHGQWRVRDDFDQRKQLRAPKDPHCVKNAVNLFVSPTALVEDEIDVQFGIVHRSSDDSCPAIDDSVTGIARIRFERGSAVIIKLDILQLG